MKLPADIQSFLRNCAKKNVIQSYRSFIKRKETMEIKLYIFRTKINA